MLENKDKFNSLMNVSLNEHLLSVSSDWRASVTLVRHPTLGVLGAFRGGIEGFLHHFVSDIRFVGVENENERQAYVCLGQTFHGHLVQYLVKQGLPDHIRDSWRGRSYQPTDGWRVFSGFYDPASGEVHIDLLEDVSEAWLIVKDAIFKYEGRDVELRLKVV